MLFASVIILHSILLFFIGLKFAKKYNFLDIPNFRKVHSKPTSYLGGLIIFLSYLFISIIVKYNTSIENIIIFGSFCILIGVADDKYNLRASAKFFMTLLPVTYLVLNGYNLNNLGYYQEINVISLGRFSIIFTILCILLLMNAINYIDGIDNILLLITITAVIYFRLLSDNPNTEKILLLMLLPLIINLIFNLAPIKLNLKIFLGNGGSLFLGFLISIIMIILAKYDSIHPAKLIWAVWLPIYDFLFINFIRIKNKINPLRGDRSHIQHIFLKYYKNDQLKSCLTLSLLNIAIIALGFSINLYFSHLMSLLAFILFFFFYMFLRYNKNSIIK
jgi:UDP-GlcNAc:undecaprenyl-phosphate GlcNAc-1-phosphate transferase